MTFDEFDLGDDVLDALDTMHFSECTPVQEKSIGVVLDGHDLIAMAQTGTGKTAAYLLPIISRLADGGYPEDRINAVIMVPTHELAQQIDRQMEGFSYFLPVTSVAIHGGTDGKEFARQQRGLTMGTDVVIATPGRLLAHMKMNYVDLSKVSFFVLDEADRMLDMGFYDDIIQIVKQLPPSRQTLMFSATMPPKIKQLAKTILTDPVEVKIAVSKPTEKVDQSVFICHEPQKEELLKHVFRTKDSKRVIVFASSKLKVKELTRILRKGGWSVAEMHSDLDQPTRERVMLDFRAGRTDILVATDVVARGIDINNISMVVNYDVPHDAEDYIHRIGRTARANAEGRAVTMVSERDRRRFDGIERFLGEKLRREPMPDGITGPTESPTADDRHTRKMRSHSDNKNRSQRKKRPSNRNAKPVTDSTPAPETTSASQTPATVTGAGTSDNKPKRRYHRRRRNPGNDNQNPPQA